MLSTLAACSTGEESVETQGSTSTEAETNAETLKDRLPNGLNYGGDEVTILSRNYGSDLVDEVFVEDLMSDPVNDAIYERNKEVEERLNIKINSIRERTEEPINKIITAISGDFSFGDGDKVTVSRFNYQGRRIPADFKTVVVDGKVVTQVRINYGEIVVIDRVQ
jgi:hypothetical protein